VNPVQVVIIGAGNVGYTIARSLSKQHSVLMIEEDEKRYEYVVEGLNVGALNANGASPKILQNVINIKTKLFLAVTERDETNIFACLAAKQIRPDLITVARVRNPDYTDGTLSGDFMNVDHIISPEYLTAAKMMKVALLENAVDYESVPSLGVEMAMFRLHSRHRDVISTPIKDLPVPENSRIIAIHRNRRVIIPKETDVLLVGDELTVIGKDNGIMEFNRMLGAMKEVKDVIVIGGGIVGEHLVTMLDRERLQVKLIEKSEAVCKALSKKFSRPIIINANGADPSVLRTENVNMADVLICATDSEEENLLSCLIAKHLGVHKVVSRYSKREYEEIFNMSGIDAAIGYYHVVANEIIKQTVPEYKIMLLLENFSEEFFGIEVGEKCRIKGKRINEIDLPEKSIIAMVVKNGEAVIPKPDTYIVQGDTVLIYATKADIAKLERTFKARIPIGP
jgi:trk system potassium uptake protein TrkA